MRHHPSACRRSDHETDGCVPSVVNIDDGRRRGAFPEIAPLMVSMLEATGEERVGVLARIRVVVVASAFHSDQ